MRWILCALIYSSSFETAVMLPTASQALPSRKCGKVHLTVSSFQETYLELNWVTSCDRSLDAAPDTIRLYDKDPLDRNEETAPRAKINVRDHPAGYYRTKIKFGFPWLVGNWEYSENLTKPDAGPHCFPYWIASFRGNEILDSNCLSIQPTWMSDNSKQLGPQRIGSLFIPGTHNSAANLGIPGLLENYVLNQDRSVWTQLIFGIRYLDFRVAYYKDDGYYLNHDLFKIQRLIPVLRVIKKFVELAPKEIIILDFHRFPYPTDFNNNNRTLHQNLVDIIHQEVGHVALPPSGFQAGKGPTLNEIWERGKSVIVCYGHRDTAREYSWLWNPLQQFWGNTVRVDDLKKFLKKSISDHNTVLNPMWALMAELTPQPIDFFFRSNNLRQLANDVNREVTKWFGDEWFRHTNIVATDYFLGNDIVKIAIEANIHFRT